MTMPDEIYVTSDLQKGLYRGFIKEPYGATRYIKAEQRDVGEPNFALLHKYICVNQDAPKEVCEAITNIRQALSERDARIRELESALEEVEPFIGYLPANPEPLKKMVAKALRTEGGEDA
jgi:hypothetical protein